MAPTNDSTVREYNLICEDPRYHRVAEILSVPSALILGRIIVKVEPKSGTATATTSTATKRKTTTRRKTTTKRKRTTKRARPTSRKSRRK